MRIKHNAGSKTERDKLAQTLAQAIKEGKENIVTDANINLPPNIIQ